MRFYQISLRTILEIVFVVSVVLAFFYWRSVPHDNAGRYQLIQPATGPTLFIDTKTGKAWRGWIGDGNWNEVPTPVAKTK